MKRGWLPSWAGLWVVVACASSPDTDAVVETPGVSLTDTGNFRRSANRQDATPLGAGDALEQRCGSLDCHGHPARNFQVFGRLAMRLPPRNAQVTPNIVGGDETTPEEYLATYRSLVALQPELTAAVMAEGGARPGRLTFIRKSRGTENHTGGQLTNPGEPLDVCFVTWLAGSANRAACTAGAMAPVPEFVPLP